MEHQSPVSENPALKQILGGKGKQLHTHEMHIRRTENGYVAKHTLGDKHGHQSADGQSNSREYNMATPEELATHVQGAMQPIPQDNEDEQ
jgi:hypothetical protein